MKKVFVGTMYCGEGDFDACCQAIINQKNVEIQHVIISNQPEKDAHNALWKSWRAVQYEGYDMFVKVDADTVLAHDEVLSELGNMMSDNPRITAIQAPLLDYFTDGNINGLNCFSPKVTFLDSKDPLFCDRQVDVGHDITVKADGVVDRLKPAGYHCFRTNDKQSFHFGLHRALKNQIHIINSVKAAWKKNGDRQRALALLGALAAKKFATGSSFNYEDEQFLDEFKLTLEQFDVLKERL